MRQIETKSDILANKNILNRVSYVPGGVSLAISNLVAGRVIQEAAVLGEPSSGVRSVLKAAPILTGSTTTAIKVSTALNQFKVGDFLTAKEGGKAYAITEIDSTDGVDTLTVGTAIDADVDGWIYEAVEESTGTYEVDASLNVAYAASSEGGATGLTDDAESEDSPAPPGLQATKATIVGTVGAAGAGNIDVVVSSDVLASDITVVVALANDDTASGVSAKVRTALKEDSDVSANFFVSGSGDEIVLTRVAALSVDGSVIKGTPDVVLETAFEVPATTQVYVSNDALMRADVREGSIAPIHLSKLALIGEVKY